LDEHLVSHPHRFISRFRHWVGYDDHPVVAHTRYVMLVKVTSKDTQTVVSALTRHAKKLPTELYKSLTWDRGKELAAHQQ
jgi:hypothetical protein